MSGGVNVLAVMDFTVTELVDACMGAPADSLAEARAAVAELIEAVEHELFGPAAQQVNRREGLRAALARVQGDAA